MGPGGEGLRRDARLIVHVDQNTPNMKTLADILDRNATLYPNATAMVGANGVRSTHAAHRQRVHRIANALIAQGFLKGDRFAVLAQNCAEYMELYGVAETTGLILVTLNWRLAATELAPILADCAPRVVFYERQFEIIVATLRKHASHVRWIEFNDLATAPHNVVPGNASDSFDSLVTNGADHVPLIRPRPEDIAYLIYTSGTTGRPKGVMLSHAAMIAAAQTIAMTASHQPTDTLLVAMPLFHVGAKIESLAVQFMGGALVVQAQFDPASWLATVARERCTVAHLAPIMVKTLVEHPARTQYDLSSLRRIHYGSAPASPDELQRAIAAFGPILAQLYGMTEHLLGTILLPHQQRPDGTAADIKRLASAGQPYHGTDIRIIADDGRDCALGEVGEIVVRSGAMMSGYWGQPALTAQVIREGWLHTGDMGLLDHGCYLTIVDRKKDMIISGGENIYCLEVENTLSSHPAVLEAAVIGVPDEKWGESVKAFVVLRAGTSVTESELIEHCRAQIASYKKPRSIEFALELPRLATRKVDKKVLRARYWVGRDRNIA